MPLSQPAAYQGHIRSVAGCDRTWLDSRSSFCSASFRYARELNNGDWAVVAYSRPDNVPGNLVALCVGALGVVYFVQKQKNDDLQLFERLFTRFNERYAAMHADVQWVAAGRDAGGDVARDREVLDAYFNLCAEEYLFYREGRILPPVWRAWCRGITAHLESDRVRAYWEAEELRGSHYGLTREVIRRGAEGSG